MKSQNYKGHTVNSDIRVWFWVTRTRLVVTTFKQRACTDLGLFEFCFQDL